MTRYDILNTFISHRNFHSFLEIGTYIGQTFRAVNCDTKVSVDPDHKTPATHHVTSDEYFSTHNDKFDIIFIDGLHEHDQVYRDITNSLQHLTHNGVIVLHDCHPTSEKMQEHHTTSQYDFAWTGDVWKAFVKARATLPYEMYVIDHDMGCGVIDTAIPRTSDVSSLPVDMSAMTYSDFTSHPEWFNFRSGIMPPSERVAVYAATRNLYKDMVVAAKSLLYHNGADIVYFLIEDDSFPHELPPCIRTMNVSNQTLFHHNGPNYSCHWTYMVLLRAALSKLFPQYDRLIHLDVDTVVLKPIDYLWSVDMTGYYYAAVEEKQITIRTHPYFNFGVAIHNLAKLRIDQADDTIINTINTVKLSLPEQDAVNSVCRRHILELPQEYNAMIFNIPKLPDDQACIKHFASKSYMFVHSDYYKHFSGMSWDDVLNHKERSIKQ